MDTIKSIGGSLLGFAIFIGFIIATVLLFSFGAKLAFTIQPFVNWLAGILLLINIVALLIAIIPKTRGSVGLFIYISSYIYGLSAWIFGLAVTLAFWGWIAVIIGIMLGGIGVVPIGMLAAIFNGEWAIFWSLFFAVVFTYGARVIGTLLMSNAENQGEPEDVIDIEPEEDKRTWRDIE
jgi:hypothetical protein